MVSIYLPVILLTTPLPLKQMISVRKADILQNFVPVTTSPDCCYRMAGGITKGGGEITKY